MRRIEELITQKPHTEEFLVEYNEFIASIYVKNFPDYKYRASPSLNKLESQTHLYQRILYFIKAKELLTSDSAVQLETDDPVIKEALDREFPGRVHCEDPGISAFSLIKRVAFYFLLTLYFKFFVKKKVGTNHFRNIVRTYFVPRSIDKAGYLRDEYLGAFTDDLMLSENSLCIYKLVDWHDWRLYQAGKAKDFFNHALVEHFLSFFDIIMVFGKFIFSNIRLQQVMFRNVDITNLINASLREDFRKTGALVTIMEDAAAENIYKLGPDFLFLPFENQAWEKVYPYQRSIVGSAVKIIGFQHTGVSFKLLNYFPSSLEKTLSIYPDVIFTVGEVIKKILDEKAYFSSRIESGGAIRHAHFVENGQIKSAPARHEINKVITYAFSYDFGLYENILKDLGEIFNGSSIRVNLKFHPLFTSSYIETHLGKYLNSNLVNALPIPWPEIYRDSDFILYDDNTVGFEGMINGIKTYMYQDADKTYDCKRDYYFGLWKHDVNKADLLKMKKELEDGTYNKSFDQVQLHSYLKSYFTPYVPKETFAKMKRIYEV